MAEVPTQVASDDDPFEAAMSAQPVSNFTIFGECRIDTYFAILQKGVGKLPFDPLQHERDKRVISIEITILPLREDQGVITRNMIAESNEWARLVKPSVAGLGLGLKDLHGKHVAAQLIPSGRKYEDKHTGETREATTIKFFRYWNTREECESARSEFLRTLRGESQPVAVSQTAPAVEPAVGETVKNTDSELETAKKFLPALWRAAGKDLEKFERLLSSQPLLKRLGIGIEHPAVMEVIATG